VPVYLRKGYDFPAAFQIHRGYAAETESGGGAAKYFWLVSVKPSFWRYKSASVAKNATAPQIER